MIATVLLLLLSACASPAMAKRRGRTMGSLLAVVLAGVTAFLAARYGPHIADGGTVTEAYPWVPTLGVALAFQLDGLSLLFSLLATGLGALVAVYSGQYLDSHEGRGKFFCALLGFTAAMVGLVCADDAITLFVFWELTSITSFFLIGFGHGKPEARQAARQALLVTGAGGLLLLAGLLLLGSVAGTTRLSEMQLVGETVRRHALYIPILLLVCAGAFTKSAQAPFHFWLPGAMAAPTPVSAYLHSATMVKAGVYLLARLDGTLGGTFAWTALLGSVGVVTMLLGATCAVVKTDLKQVLAYSTVAVLGMLVALLGLSFDASIAAAVVLILVHALYKGPLFLVVGIVEHATGTRDVRRLGGLARKLPATAAAAFLAGLSMAGLPPLFGFVGKELAYKAKLGAGGGDVVLPVLAALASALTVAAASLVALRPFVGSPPDAGQLRRPSALMVAPVIVLSLGGLLLGTHPALVANLIDPAVAAVLDRPADLKLMPFYGLGPAFYLSLATVAAGVLLAIAVPRLRRPLGPVASAAEAAGALWDAALSMVVRRGGAAIDAVSKRDASTHVLISLLVLLLLAGTAGGLPAGSQLPALRAVGLEQLLAVSLVAVGAVLAATIAHRLTAVLAVGVAGLGTALLFVTFGAPDLGLTQVLVELLVVVAVAFALLRLPLRAQLDASGRARRLLKLAVSLGVGGLMAALTLAAAASGGPRELSAWLTAHSVEAGHGRNVVNVILVDFRALDTLGELTVLAAAAMGVAMLTAALRLRSET